MYEKISNANNYETWRSIIYLYDIWGWYGDFCFTIIFHRFSEFSAYVGLQSQDKDCAKFKEQQNTQ